jgi:hypothetical protein
MANLDDMVAKRIAREQIDVASERLPNEML